LEFAFTLTRTLKLILVASMASLSAGAMAQSTQSKLSRQLSYIDLGVQGVGELTRTVSGPVPVQATDEGTLVNQSASTTVGALATIRYTPKPYFGLEFNGSYARYTESYTVQPLQIQTQSNEFTFGYIVTPPYTIFGVKPYASAGLGTVRFAPTRGGGQGAPTQARLGYYYSVGVQKDVVPDTFGIRVGFRQLFFQAPDFYQNYLTLNKRTFTSEPTIGFYLRF
jgi:opacity protein-like surface antigen